MIYLAGKISGLDPKDVEKKFSEKAAYLRERYQVKVINPVELIKQENKMRIRLGKSAWTDKENRKEILDFCLSKLGECKRIYLMNCFENSEGAVAEHAYSLAIGLGILYEL